MKKKILITILLIVSVCIVNINNTYATTSSSETQKHTFGEIMQEGEDFISASKGEEKISQASLKNMSDTIYNILLVLGIVIAVILGAILGIKFMTEGVEGQADVKKALVPYIIGCVVIFGSFTIWKIVVNILKTV